MLEKRGSTAPTKTKKRTIAETIPQMSPKVCYRAILIVLEGDEEFITNWEE
jgi:hypothetical protein